MRDFNRSRLQEELRDKAMDNVRHNLRQKEEGVIKNFLSHECESEKKCQKLSLEMPKNAKRLEMPKPISQELCWHHQQCAIY